VLSSLAARETFVATIGQVAAAEDPQDPGGELARLTYEDGEHAGEPVFSPGVVAALLVFFGYALQCMATVAAIRRETGTWRWGALAWTYMFALAWVAAFAARSVVDAVAG
jgi:ferrous iron transport protein B